MSAFVAELIGTMILVVLGDGVVANVLLTRSKGEGSGWMVIATGWGLAVSVAVYAVGSVSGAHINPAVTIGLASIGRFPWADVPIYIAGQLLGAILGGVVVWLAYRPHWQGTADPDLKLAVFCTAPAVRQFGANVVTEIIAPLFSFLVCSPSYRRRTWLPKQGSRWEWDLCWWACWSGRSGCHWVGRPDMPSIQQEI